jgi:hypothetical protein
MIMSIIQPCFVPWLGYFEQIALADVFVYLDDVQYTRQDWRNNNQLKSPVGAKGIYFSVNKAPRGTPIKDIQIAHHLPWVNTLRNQLFNWYGNAPYYYDVMELLEPHLQARYPDLVTFNRRLNQSILDYLGFDTPIFQSSDIANHSNDKVERISEICRHFDGVNVLFDGRSAQNFLNPDSFASVGVKVVFQDYQHQPYPQLWGEFIPYMSILDCLFNCGPDAQQYIVTESSRRSLSL